MEEALDHNKQIMNFAHFYYEEEMKNIHDYKDLFTSFIIRYVGVTQNLRDFNSVLKSQRGRLVLDVARKLVINLSLSEKKIDPEIYMSQEEKDAEAILDLILEGFAPARGARPDHDALFNSDELSYFGRLTCEDGDLNSQFENSGPEIKTSDLAIAASTYLRSGFRTPFIDRLIFTGLAHGEMGSFAFQSSSKLLQAIKGSNANALHLLKDKQRKLNEPVIYSALISFFGYFAISLAVFFGWKFFNLTYELLNFGICALIMTIWCVRILILKSEQKRYDIDPAHPVKRYYRTWDAMARFYDVLQDQSDLSIKVIRRDLDRIKESGGWFPGVMWVVLDTLESEGITALTWDFDVIIYN